MFARLFGASMKASTSPSSQLDPDRDDDEQDRHQHAVPDVGVRGDILVVLQPDEWRVVRRHQVEAPETRPQQIERGENGHQKKDANGWHDQRPAAARSIRPASCFMASFKRLAATRRFEFGATPSAALRGVAPQVH